MKKRETKVIGECRYEITQCGAIDGAEGLLRLKKLGADTGGDVDKLINKMSAEDLRYFCDLFSKNTRLIKIVNGKPIASELVNDFDDHFAGEGYYDMVQWLLA